MAGLDDGYGDELTNAEVVANFYKWTHYVAGQIVSPYRLDYDDVVQEGLITIWRILEKKGGKAKVAATYLTLAARYRMIAFANGKPPTGGNSRPGPKTEPPHTQSLDALTTAAASAEFDFDVERFLVAPDLLASAELAYHEGELLDTLAAMPERDRAYVVMRFWGGMTEAEISEHLGVERKTLNSHWAKAIRPTLVRQLAHLAGAV